MNTRTLFRWMTPTAPLALLGLGVVLAWPGSSPQAQVSDAFTTFSVNCRDFDRAWFTVGWAARKGLVHARSDGRIGVDVLGIRSRLTWDGQTVRYDYSAIEPRREESLEPFFADVWSECRSGFANSTWVAQAPWEVDGFNVNPHPWMDWARLDLPFAWAQGVTIFVGIQKPDVGEQMEFDIRVGDSDPERLFVREVDWESNFPDQALLPDSPPFDPPRPSYWVLPIE